MSKNKETVRDSDADGDQQPRRLIPDPCRVYRANELAKLLSVHPITIWKWNRDGRLPRGLKLGPGVTVWRAVDVERWLDAKAEERAP